MALDREAGVFSTSKAGRCILLAVYVIIFLFLYFVSHPERKIKFKIVHFGEFPPSHTNNIRYKTKHENSILYNPIEHIYIIIHEYFQE